MLSKLSAFCLIVISTFAAANAGELTLPYGNPPGRSLAIGLGMSRAGRPQMQMAIYTFSSERSVFNLGEVAPAGAADFKPRIVSSERGAAARSEAPAFEVSCGFLQPGATIRTDTQGLDLFLGLGVRPQYLAYSSNGKPVVKPASEGTVALDGLDAPWILAWWGEKTPAWLAWRQADGRLSLNDFRHAPVHGAFDIPCLILLQNSAKSVEVSKEGWRLNFDDKAGTVVFLPLFGYLNPAPIVTDQLASPEQYKVWKIAPPLFAPVYVEQPATAAWKDGLPQEVVADVQGWARRLRRIPVGVKETHEVVGAAVKVTETFTYEDVDDAWKTPKRPWAFLPPIFGLSKAMNGPIEVEPGAKEIRWAGVFGPLCVLDGKDSISFTIRIPQIEQALNAKPVAFDRSKENPRFKVLLDRLRGEIDKVLAMNEHLAPLACPSKHGWHPAWDEPSTPIIALCWALPFMERDKAEKLKAYIAREFREYSPLECARLPLGVGARRELFAVESPPSWKAQTAAPKGVSSQALYAAWKFADNVGGVDAAAALWPVVKGIFEKDLASTPRFWDGGDCRPGGRAGGRPPVPSLDMERNARLNDYLGVARLARLAGDRETEALATCLLARGWAVTHAMAYYHQFLIEQGLCVRPRFTPPGLTASDKGFAGYMLPTNDGWGPMTTRGLYNFEMLPLHFFQDLGPDTIDFVRAHCQDPVHFAVRHLLHYYPHAWLNKGNIPFGAKFHEWWLPEPWLPQSVFLGLAAAVAHAAGR